MLHFSTFIYPHQSVSTVINVLARFTKLEQIQSFIYLVLAKSWKSEITQAITLPWFVFTQK